MPDITPYLSYGAPGIMLAALIYILPDLKEHLRASSAALRATADTLRSIEPRLANIEKDTSTTREDLAAMRVHLAMDRDAALRQLLSELPAQQREKAR